MTLRRTNALLTAVGVGLLVYSFFFLALVDRIARLCGAVGLTGALKESSGHIEVWGMPVPLWCVALLWLFLPILCFALDITYRLERRYRDAHGLCPDCGYRLTSWRGKCPGCGLRIGPG